MDRVLLGVRDRFFGLRILVPQFGVQFVTYVWVSIRGKFGNLKLLDFEIDSFSAVRISILRSSSGIPFSRSHFVFLAQIRGDFSFFIPTPFCRARRAAQGPRKTPCISIPMDIRKLTDDLLLTKTSELAREERRLTLEVLRHLQEIERRRLYAARGYPSLFEYAVRELGYPEGSAQRRISSMRLLKELPELEGKIESGSLSLSVMSQAQSFFRQEEIREPEKKREILMGLENHSTREAERKLASQSREPVRLTPEKVRPLSENVSRLELAVDQAFLDQLGELRALLSHSHPGMSIREALAYALELSLSKHRPKAPSPSESPPAPAVGNPSLGSASATEAGIPSSYSPPAPAVGSANFCSPSVPVQASLARRKAPPIHTKTSPTQVKVSPSQRKTPASRFIPAAIKRWVWHRDQGQCSYQDPRTGRRCRSRHFLQLDHIHPYALGGRSVPQNLRLLCFAHNQWLAAQVFGTSFQVRPGKKKVSDADRCS
jgi:hypothetical protein